jgi:predicted MFS family arabinose efflux permease
VPLSAAVVFGLTFVGFFIQGVGNVAAATLLTSDTRAGRATTMTLNGVAMSLAAAAGGSSGGILLALGGFPATGLMAPVCGAAAALLLWRSRQASDTTGA